MRARLVRGKQKSPQRFNYLPICGLATMKRRTGTNRGTPSMVDFVWELGAWDRAVATEGVHHSRI